MADKTLTTEDLATTSEDPGTEARSPEQDAEPRGEERVPAFPGAGEEPLLPEEEADRYRARWEDVQTGFVDEPRQAVEAADQLVAEVMKRVAESFADERANLEGQWDRGDEVNTEDLRVAMHRYRSFFNRLLTV
jgi:hypothetical protein